MRCVCVLVVLVLAFCFKMVAAVENCGLQNLTRQDFPADFVFGSSSSAYQYEGAAHEDGRGLSVWDTFTQNHPVKIADRSNGTVAVDSYHRYKEDVQIMKDIGLNAYRFSISWPRILPRGNLKGGINQAGIDYYNNLINELLSKGIKPFVTLFHWDTPQALEDAYGGFRSSKIADDFQDYADLCFQNFGDRVKYWITLNEPLTLVQFGYGSGVSAPGRCSKFVNPNCTGGDSATEPYIVGHNLLLAHAAAVNVYREKYQTAAARNMAFTFDWFMEPLVTGNYPAEMVSRIGDRLPNFTDEQSAMLKGSYDFIGVNYYTSSYAQDVPCATVNVTYSTDPCTNVTGERNGVSMGPPAASPWLLVYPRGIRDLLLYAKYKFKYPVIYITENGIDEANTGTKTLNDTDRIDYYDGHLRMVRNAISVGANVKGFFAWSLLDNFEWNSGYTVRFGLVYIDFNDGLKRYPKDSAKWLGNFLRGMSI